MTLNELKVGQSGTISAVGGDGALRCRLLDMGLTPRTCVTLRVEDAQKITVEAVEWA